MAAYKVMLSRLTTRVVREKIEVIVAADYGGDVALRAAIKLADMGRLDGRITREDAGLPTIIPPGYEGNAEHVPGTKYGEFHAEDDGSGVEAADGCWIPFDYFDEFGDRV